MYGGFTYAGGEGAGGGGRGGVFCTNEKLDVLTSDSYLVHVALFSREHDENLTFVFQLYHPNIRPAQNGGLWGCHLFIFCGANIPRFVRVSFVRCDTQHLFFVFCVLPGNTVGDSHGTVRMVEVAHSPVVSYGPYNTKG